MATLSPEQRAILEKIKTNDIVKSVDLSFYRIKVRFKDGLYENWVLRPHHRLKWTILAHKLPMNDLSNKDVNIYSEFETHPFSEDENKLLEPFFIIQRRDIKRAKFVDLRLAVHRLIFRMVTEGWIDLKYPSEVLNNDLNRLMECDSEAYFSGPSEVSAWSSIDGQYQGLPGRRIAEHFLKWGDFSDGTRRTLREAWSDPSCLYASIESILGLRLDITRANIVRHLGIINGRRNSGPKFISPWLYCAIIKSFFRAHQTIYDHCPEYGSKLMAAGILKSDYAMAQDHQEGLEQMAHFIGCNLCEPMPRYDLSILSGMVPLTAGQAIPLLDKYLRRSNGVLVLVNRDDANKVSKTFKPKRMLKAFMSPRFLKQSAGHHFFFIY